MWEKVNSQKLHGTLALICRSQCPSSGSRTGLQLTSHSASIAKTFQQKTLAWPPGRLACSSKCSSAHPPIVIWLVCQGQVAQLNSQTPTKKQDASKNQTQLYTKGATGIIKSCKKAHESTQALLTTVDCKEYPKSLAEATTTPRNYQHFVPGACAATL